MNRKPLSDSRRRLAERWQKITEAPNPLRALAENVSEAAREALNEAQQITVERQTVWLPRLPKEFDGLRVVQLSDLHHSPQTSAEQIAETIRIANNLAPDLFVLTGDYVSHEPEYIAPVADMLGELKAEYGVFAVLGNHDHWTDAAMVSDMFRAEGIEMLVNKGFRFELNNASIWLCGVDDTLVGLADLDLALAGAREDEFKFLLCHNPAILRRAARAGVDFILSGHTHGGQIRLRQQTEGLLMPTRRRASGLLKRGETQIYISRGIGTVVVPFRYQCPPEITLLELRSVDF